MTEEELSELCDRLLGVGHELIAIATKLGHSNGNGNGFRPLEEKLAEALEERVRNRDREPAPERERLESVGRFGKVTEEDAKKKAQELGTFSRNQFGEVLGLQGPAVTRWLNFLAREEVILYIDGEYRCLLTPTLRDWVVRQTEPFSLIDAAEGAALTDEEAQEELAKLAGRNIVRQLDEESWEYVPPDSIPNPREHETRPPPEALRPSYDLAPVRGMPIRVAATKRATRRQRSVSGASGIKGAKQKDKRYNEAQAKKQERAEQAKTKAQQNPKFKSRSNKRSRAVA